MNWFNRHLNWSLILMWLGLSLIVAAIGIGIEYAKENAYANVRYHNEFEAFEAARHHRDEISQGGADFRVVGAVLASIPTCWYLLKKNRSLLFTFLIFVPLAGWIILLCLEKKSKPPETTKILTA